MLCRGAFVVRLKGWCERGDSNPHPLRDQILSLARLPIPPLSHDSIIRQTATAPGRLVAPGVEVAFRVCVNLNPASFWLTFMRILPEKDANDAAASAARRSWGLRAITLLKSWLLPKSNSAHFGGFFAPPSRPKTDSSCIYGRAPDPIWWCVSAQSLLPAAALAPMFREKSALPATQQRLQHPRNVVSVAVPDYSRAWASRHHRAVAPEWCLPGGSRGCRPIRILLPCVVFSSDSLSEDYPGFAASKIICSRNCGSVRSLCGGCCWTWTPRC